MHTPSKIAFVILAFAFFCAGALPAHAQVNVTQEFVPNNVTIVWESQTYVPPFYKGKALYVDGANATLFALPPADLGDPATLTYEWKIDGEVEGDASGIGRNLFLYRPGIFGGSPLIVVNVYKNGQKAASGALRLPQVKPTVLVYPALPLAGILFGNIPSAIQGDEITLETYPLFFGVKTKADPALSYAWKINGEYMSNPLGNSSRLILRSDNKGEVGVVASVSNARNILESANTALTLTFDK